MYVDILVETVLDRYTGISLTRRRAEAAVYARLTYDLDILERRALLEISMSPFLELTITYRKRDLQHSKPLHVVAGST